MPVPVSVTQSETYGPGGKLALPGGAFVQPFVGGLDGQLAAFRHGVARIDAKIEQRIFQLRRIHPHRPQARRRPPLRRRHWGPWCGGPGLPCRRSGGWHRRAVGSRVWRREKASSRWVRAAARLADSIRRLQEAINIIETALPAMRFCTRSNAPVMPCSRLLKSWAMPPVSWPTASIFCAWRRASSVCSELGLPFPFWSEISRALQ